MKKSKAPEKNKLITSFFSSTAKTTTEFPEPKEINNIEAFYIEQLKGCNKNTCEVKKSDLQKQLNAAKAKLAQIEKAQAAAMTICTEKDEEISILQRQTQPNNTVVMSNVPVIVSYDAASSSAREEVTPDKPFTKFADSFNGHQLSSIQSIGISCSQDSTFILEVIRSLYAENIEKLHRVTVTGRSKDESKEPISPKKKEVLSSMFIERLKDQPQSDVRMRNLNKLAGRAIVNITKVMKKKNSHDEAMSKINETFKNNEK